MMRELVDNCQLAAIPHIKSKVRYFKDKFTATLELKEASGFGWDDARGCVIAEEGVFAEWVKPSDAASMLEPRVLLSDFMSEQNTVNADSYTFPANLDHDEVMAEIVNQGIDLEATGLKELDVAMSGRKLKGKGQQSATSSGTKRTRAQAFKEDSGRIADTIEVATENIAKIATNYCIEGELAVKRQGLYQELAEFYELSVVDRTRALRHLNRDDGDATTYFQLLTMEEKRTFVSILLE
ncbi:hypothetical protein LINPERHAP1_LOCUS27981 [Linum perenne]